jgi:RNA polymerase-binding protein DksA
MGKQPEKKSKLTPDEIEVFKTMLLEKRNKLLGTISYMENDVLRVERSDLSSMPVHMADLGTDSFEQEFTLELMDSERKLIVEINDALIRIENGTYGICEINGEPIPKQRLEAIPWARCCIACASLLEKGLIKKEEYFNKYNFASGIDDESNADLDDVDGTE